MPALNTASHLTPVFQYTHLRPSSQAHNQKKYSKAPHIAQKIIHRRYPTRPPHWMAAVPASTAAHCEGLKNRVHRLACSADIADRSRYPRLSLRGKRACIRPSNRLVRVLSPQGCAAILFYLQRAFLFSQNNLHARALRPRKYHKSSSYQPSERDIPSM